MKTRRQVVRCKTVKECIETELGRYGLLEDKVFRDTDSMDNEIKGTEEELKRRLKCGMKILDEKLKDCLALNRDSILMQMDTYLVDEDKNLLYPKYPEVLEPIINIDTWTIPLLRFVMARLYKRKVASCVDINFIRLIDMSINRTVRLKAIFDGKLENLINKLDGDEISEHYNLEEYVIKDEEGVETTQKYLFQNLCSEDTTEEVRGEISDSFNVKDDEEEEVTDDDETYKVFVDKSILAIKECMDPEPILDRFQAYADIPYTDVRDIRQQTTTTQKNTKIIDKIRQKHSCYKQFKKYLVESSQSLLLEYIVKTENGEDTTDVLKHLKEEIRRRELKEKREQKLKEENTRNSFEEQLVISISKGQDFDGTEEIDERLTIYTSADPNSRSYCNVVKCILEGATETHSEQIVKAVKDVASIINMKIKTSIDEDNTVIMTMACISCEELRELLKILGGDEFKSKICNLENVLSEEYNTNCKIQDKVSHEKIQEVQKHLIDQGVVNEEYSDKVFCGTHHQHEVELFCPQHDQFFCYECEEKHRMCKGLRQITKDENTKEYRIRSDEPKEELCTTLKLCLLPTCEVLLVDNVNKRLKKLDLTYHVVGQYQFEDNDTPLAVSGSKAVVTLGHTVYVVNVENTIKVDSYFRTEKPCFRFDRKGNIIYYTDNERIYKCDENGKRLDELHRFKAQTFCNCLIVSNDSGKIIVGARKKCLMIINTNKSEQSTLILEGLTDCTDLCMLSNRIVLVCEKNSLCLVDIEQGQRVKTVAVKSMGFLKYRSIVFDETNNTVIAGNLAKDFITVFEVDTEYEAP